MRAFKLIKQEDDRFQEPDIYSEDSRELSLEDNELSPEEPAFMKGWNDAG